LIFWADQIGNAAAMKQRLMELYFSEGGDLTDPEVLVKAAAECGLNPGEVRTRLRGDDDIARITAEAQSAHNSGINSVPCFIFGDKLAISGAQSPEYLASLIERAAGEPAGRAAAE
jgi:predicted DsbA family dithiol-disulfide isomerase